jgi:hypothetical protein
VPNGGVPFAAGALKVKNHQRQTGRSSFSFTAKIDDISLSQIDLDQGYCRVADPIENAADPRGWAIQGPNGST